MGEIKMGGGGVWNCWLLTLSHFSAQYYSVWGGLLFLYLLKGSFSNLTFYHLFLHFVISAMDNSPMMFIISSNMGCDFTCTYSISNHFGLLTASIMALPLLEILIIFKYFYLISFNFVWVLKLVVLIIRKIYIFIPTCL